ISECEPLEGDTGVRVRILCDIIYPDKEHLPAVHFEGATAVVSDPDSTKAMMDAINRCMEKRDQVWARLVKTYGQANICEFPPVTCTTEQYGRTIAVYSYFFSVSGKKTHKK